MPPTLRCPACDARFTPSPDDADRRRVPCPDCGKLVPTAPSARWSDGNRPARRQSGGGRLLAVGLLIAGVIGLGCCGGIVGLVWWADRPTAFPEPTQDYAAARAGFTTTLVQTGPAPQRWDEEVPPPGVDEVEFASGKLTLTAWVDPPPAGGPLKPGVLFLHGGYAFGAEDWDQAKPFRDAGFVTFLPTLRGENGRPGAYTMFYDEVDDVLAAADALARTPGVDPDRLYVAGHSVGGTMTMLAAMTTTKFRAAASFSGSPDQQAFARWDGAVVPFDQTDPREFAMRSPLAYYNSFKCPVRVYFGSEEDFFRPPSERLAEKATEAGADLKAVEVPGDHMTSVAPAMWQAIAFFRAHEPAPGR